MHSGFCISALDTSVEVRFAEGAKSLVDAAARAWSRCLEEPMGSHTAEPLHVASPDDDSDIAVKVALQHLTQAVTLRLIEAQVGRLLMLHAGAVSHPLTGESLVFVAPAGTGKTTLTCVLARTYGYLTDETVGIDSSGRIHPYPKPLSLRLPGGGPKRETSPDDLGLRVAHHDPRVRRIILLDRSPDHAGHPLLERLGLLDAIQEVLPQTSSLGKLPRPLQMLAGLAEQLGPVLRCSYGEADDLLGVTAELIGMV
jgi:hypothetical protein